MAEKHDAKYTALGCLVVAIGLALLAGVLVRVFIWSAGLT